MSYMSGRIHFRDEKLKYANKNNFLGCKKIPIDLWLNLSEKKVYSTLLVQYPNTLLTRAHFHYTL